MKSTLPTDLDPIALQNITEWLDGPYDETTKLAIRKLLEQNPQELVDAFYTHLAFGTGGLRGIMGVGSNRMNRYTVGAATQGLANYLNQQIIPPEGLKVIIGYDSRNHSREFAEEAAAILAANHIHVYIFKEIRPVSLVSFGCRFKKCIAGIMITASHNPPIYNGFKVYWEDGAQVLPPHDINIIREVEKIKNPSFVKKSDLKDPKIYWMDTEMDENYLRATDSLQNFRENNQKEGASLKIVYTSLHGTGITMVPKILNKWGFSQLTFVEEQIIPDGNFPTAHSPNPEESATLSLGIQKLKKTNSDIFIATDPDCDRLGIVVKHKNSSYTFTGNQIACLCLQHLCETLSNQQRLPHDAVFIKTLVTTELFQSICDNYNRPCVNVLTGFKYVAEKIREWEKDNSPNRFIFGGEESYGYLYGTFSRDKDAVIVSALICEAALQAKMNSLTLVEKLHALYKKYGFYHEKLLNLQFEESKQGRDQIIKGIAGIQAILPKDLNGHKILSIEDYHRSLKFNLLTDQTEPLHFPKNSMIIFWLENGSKLVIRPSGTEPKIKIYCGIVLKNFNSIEEAEKICESQANQLVESLANHIKN